MSVREEVGLLRDTCHIILDSMKVLWMHRDVGFTDLQHRNVGHHMEVPGRIAAIYEPALPRFEDIFGLLARVSRQPFWSLTFTASSTTEFVLRHGCLIAQAID